MSARFGVVCELKGLLPPDRSRSTFRSRWHARGRLAVPPGRHVVGTLDLRRAIPRLGHPSFSGPLQQPRTGIPTGTDEMLMSVISFRLAPRGADPAFAISRGSRDASPLTPGLTVASLTCYCSFHLSDPGEPLDPRTPLRVPPGCAGDTTGRLAAHFASRSSCSRRGVGPSSRSAYRTTGSDPDRVTAFRTHELRPGWAPSVPRGRRCSSRPGPLPDRCLPLRNGQSLHPAPASHLAGPALNEASTKGSRMFARPVFPSLWPPGWNGPPLGSSLAFAPRRPRADDARQGRDRPSSTDLELHAQHHISRSPIR